MKLHFDSIQTRARATDCAAAIRLAAAPLLAQNKITPAYVEAVVAREAIFPTGLPAACGAAIPHADPEGVLEEAISVVTFEEPVVFHGMGAPQECVDVVLLFFLAIRDGAAQIDLLQQIVSILQDEMVLHQIKDANSAEKVYNILNEFSQEKNKEF